MTDDYDFSEDRAITNGEKPHPLVWCENGNKCGATVDICAHGKPHEARRCGSCGTWCTGSNGLCSGGQCSHPKYGGTFFPGRCVPVERGR